MGLFSRLRRGPVSGELTSQLTNEGRGNIFARYRSGRRGATPDGRPPEGLTNAELSVLISIDDTIAHRDQRRGRRMVKAQRALVNAAHRSTAATDQLAAAKADPRWVNGGLIDSDAGEPEAPADALTTAPEPAAEPSRRQRRRDRKAHRSGTHLSTFREMFDPNHPLIGERTLTAVEIIFVCIELVFWYGVFSENLNAGAGIFDPVRISDVLLAVILPLSGIVAARVVGSLGHRVASRYPGIGYKERVGAVLASIVAIFALIAIFYLVHDRFANPPLGSTPLPATPMTLVFVVVLLGDMVARVFMVSEIRTQTEKWLRHLDRLKATAIEANRVHAEAWLGLRNDTQVQLDRIERIVATGARIISDQRSRNGVTAPTQVLAGTGVLRSAHSTEDELSAYSAMAVPSTAQMELYGVQLALGPIRLVSDAANTLRRWVPRDQPALETYLAEILERLYRVKPTAADEAPQSGAADPESIDQPESGPMEDVATQPDLIGDASVDSDDVPVFATTDSDEDSGDRGRGTTTLERPRSGRSVADDDVTERVDANPGGTERLDAEQDTQPDPVGAQHMTNGLSAIPRRRLPEDQPLATVQVDGIDPRTRRHYESDAS